ncbi:MAG TPA: DegT/DnrJ/EryC1/StrS family aminotransferase [Bryobacteraceae bacterium]|nr:DegT/DnrJ/EryC1/StrS family aminotransferase [Bryobacteraceae bacterium]
MKVPMLDLRPQLSAAEPELAGYLGRLFDRMQFILGEQVSHFEREFARRLGAACAAGVGSGTAALELCLRSAGLPRSRREVITSALSSPFTAQAILAAGALPRFADIDPSSLLLDPEDLAERINRKTGAVVPVHLYGQPCDLDRIAALSTEHDAALIQDACQAHGARYQGKPFTRYSRWVAYSFYPTKNLGCLGDGGAVATDSAGVAAEIRLLRDGGRDGDQFSRLPAINSRLDEMQACYLRAFLPHLDDWNSRRARLAALYDEALAGCTSVRPVGRSPESVNHLYVIRAQTRDRLRKHLQQQGIATAVHYPQPLHLHPAFDCCGAKPGSFPHAEKACREIVSLPLWPYMPESAVLRVVERVRAFYLR